MPNTYTIIIQNNSGSNHDYALFTDKPIVSGTVGSQIFQNVFAIAATGKDQSATVQITRDFYAICGAANVSPAPGVVVNVAGTHKINLGAKASDGTVIGGTSLPFNGDDGFAQFGPEISPSNGQANAFNIVTANTFTLDEAKNSTSNYVLIDSGML